MMQAMSGQIIPLKCPSCGNTHSEQLREHVFGAEFKCESCGMTSVLVINKQLHLRQVGEHVCKSCGRVAPKGTRFCQCGLTLIQKCRDCKSEHSIDETVCPQCGWLSSTELYSDEGISRTFNRLEHKMTSHIFEDCSSGWKKAHTYINDMWMTNRPTDPQLQQIANHLAQIIEVMFAKNFSFANGALCLEKAKSVHPICDYIEPKYDFSRIVSRSWVAASTRLIHPHEAPIVQTLERLISYDTYPHPNQSISAIKLLGEIGAASIGALERILLNQSPHDWRKHKSPGGVRYFLAEAFMHCGSLGDKVTDRLCRGIFVASDLREFGKIKPSWIDN